ncbi:MAG: hypothetical protein MI919_23865, partial [Holophagales bacterium]|nr:hypothetical protein [Holophagales bacterium]
MSRRLLVRCSRRSCQAIPVLALAAVIAVSTEPVSRASDGEDAAGVIYDEALFRGIEARNIGPFRGGRSVAVAGVIQDPLSYYMGTTGGGLWRTTDAGLTWTNISDGHFATGSVGAVAVAPSDPNVIWVGMGEACIRGVMTTHGDGVYRSTDRGKTWTHLGLADSQHISKVLVHPHDPDTAWVGVQGHAWGPNDERGVYRTTDGGITWERSLFVGPSVGVADMALDTTNPRILYAALWRHRRYPWKIESGGGGDPGDPAGGIWKSTDSGVTWKKLEKGLPELPGKIGVAVSPAEPERVWAIVEAEKGGLYRSDDGGKSWKLLNDARLLQTRSWYYMHVFAHPQNAEVVWVLNAPALRSIDGGKSFQIVRTPHGDNHDMWIHPHDPRYMINANDGGANVSTNAGATWSVQTNQPTAQFYRVAVDDLHPYNVYGGQQDHSAIRIQSRSTHGGITERHWVGISGCESADPAFDPENPRYVYGGCYQGIVSEWDAVTHRDRDVMAYPYLGLSVEPRETRYRFNWNAPLLVSAHDPQVIYHAANVVLRSSNRGQSWQEVSPDLTRDEESLQGHGGGPITSEGAGGEVYNTILSLAESPFDPEELWVGTDDGLVKLTRDGGVTWRSVRPEGPWSEETGDGAMINTIELSPHQAGKAYLAVTRYKWDDLQPLVFVTRDHGETWQSLAAGLPANTIVRAVREDPAR